jgi:hypothetical protein
VADRLQSGCWHNGSLYVGYYRDSSASPGGRVFKIDAIAGQITMIGGDFPNGSYFLSPHDFCSFNGQLFVAAASVVTGAEVPPLTGAKVFRMNPDTESTWTVDATFSDLDSLKTISGGAAAIRTAPGQRCTAKPTR